MKTQLVSVSEETSGTYCIHIEESCESGQLPRKLHLSFRSCTERRKEVETQCPLVCLSYAKGISYDIPSLCSWIGFIQKPVATVGPSLHLLSPLQHVNILRLVFSGSDSPFSSLLRKSLPAAIHRQPLCSGATPCLSLLGHLLSGL